jgi:hypothetical protein
MERQYTCPRKMKLIVGLMIGGFVLAALFHNIDTATEQGCSLLKAPAWIVLEILPAVIRAGWQCVQAYLSENSRVLQHLPQVVAYIWPLFCGVVW